MRQSTLAFICGFILVVILAVSWCGRQPPPEIVSQPTPSPTPTATATATPALSATASVAVAQVSATPTPQPIPPELQKAAEKIGPAVIEVAVFDQSGQLLRTGTGFYISGDGRFVTSLRTVEGGAHAVAKSPDGKIRNVIGVLGSSTALDVALLMAETKTGVPFIRLSNDSEPDNNLSVAIVGSSSQRKQPVSASTIVSQKTDEHGAVFEVSTALPKDSAGSPVIDADGEAIGVVASAAADQGTVVRPAAALNSLVAQIKPGTVAHWAGEEAESPTPTPAPRRLRVLYNPAPRYPNEARFSSFGAVKGTGTFRVVFGVNGLVKDVQTVQSTGKFILDQAAQSGLRQWKAEPGREWSVLVPITFQP